MRQAGILLALFAVLLSCQFHLAVLQGVAWAGMWLENSRSSASVSEALAKTLDGQRPCDLCVFVQSELAQEQAASEEVPPAERSELAFIKLLPLPGLLLAPACPQGERLPQALSHEPAGWLHGPEPEPPRLS